MNTNDLALGFDPTASTSLTGPQFASLITSATPSSDRGFVINTTDGNGVPNLPNVATTPILANYTWRRVSPLTNSVATYVWNPSQLYNLGYSDGSGQSVSTNWNPMVNAAIGAGSIVNGQLAGGITYDKLAGSIQTSQLVDGSTFLTTTSTPTVVDIAGSFTAGFTIQAGAVTGAKMAALTVAASNIAAGAATLTKLDTTGLQYQLLGNPTAGVPAWTTPPAIYTTANIPVTANGNKLLAVNGTATDYTLLANVLPLQFVSVITTSIVGNTGVLANTTSTPNYNATGMSAAFNSGAITPVDTTSSSKYRISVKIVLATNTKAFVGLYNAAGATAPIAGVGVGSNSLGGVTVAFDYITAANPGIKTYYVAFGVVTGGSPLAYMNSIDGANNLFLVTQSSITVEEIL